MRESTTLVAAPVVRPPVQQLRTSTAEAYARARAMARRIRPHVARLKQPLRGQVTQALADLAEMDSQAQLGMFLPAIWPILGILATGFAALGFVWAAQTGHDLVTEIRGKLPEVAEEAKETANSLLATVKYAAWAVAGILLLRFAVRR